LAERDSLDLVGTAFQLGDSALMDLGNAGQRADSFRVLLHGGEQ
jgi:hypothetical protein